jgi:hypothetical protein
MEHMSSSYPQPTFARIGDQHYRVGLGQHSNLGTVWNVCGIWKTMHNEGTPGPSAHTRIDAAWALINS